MVYLVINNSLTEPTIVELPEKTEQYILSAETIRSTVIRINGVSLKLNDWMEHGEISPLEAEAGQIVLAPGCCGFFVI